MARFMMNSSSSTGINSPGAPFPQTGFRIAVHELHQLAGQGVSVIPAAGVGTGITLVRVAVV